MQYSFLATHYQWGHQPVSSLDYFTMILSTYVGEKMYVYVSFELHGYITDPVATRDYDDTYNAGLVTDLENNVAVTLGGRFQVRYKYRDYKSAEFHLKIDNNDDNKKIYES